MILSLLDEYSYLRTKHFYELIPKTTTGTTATWQRSVRRSLHLAEKAALLTHEEIHERLSNRRSGFNHSESIYYLKGNRSPASLQRDIAITDFHLALKQAVRREGRGLNWIQRSLRRGQLNPDALFALSAASGGRRANWFFLEIERSRQGHYRKHLNSGLIQKLRRYDAITSEAAQRIWGFDDFRVLVIVENVTRATNLLHKLGTILPYRFIWIATAERTRQRELSEVIFSTPFDYASTSHSLFDL